MKLQASGEDYLKTILLLQRQQGYVRATDIAEVMQYTGASVSRAIKLLQKNAYIYLDAHKMIFLTDKGQQKANQICERYQFFIKFLTDVLHVEPQTAMQDACRLEHAVSDSTFQQFQQYFQQ